MQKYDDDDRLYASVISFSSLCILGIFPFDVMYLCCGPDSLELTTDCSLWLRCS